MSPLPLTLSRSLLTILVPGVVAIAPWALAVVQQTDASLGYGGYPVLGNALFFAAVVVAGSICEGLGTMLETRWDRSRERRFEITENWYIYLSKSFAYEPVGYGYISRLVTSMYFELSMLIATPVFAAGSWVLAATRFPAYQSRITLIAALFTLALAGYLYWQAQSTHAILCRTRRELNRRVGATPHHGGAEPPGLQHPDVDTRDAG